MTNVMLKGSTLPLKENEHGVIYGGDVLGVMDIGAGYFANTLIGGCMTKAINNMNFHKPLPKHCIYEVECDESARGKTSLTVTTKLFAMTKKEPERKLVASGDFIFVKVDERLRPTRIKS